MAFAKRFSIGTRTVGVAESTLLIAEIGRNHNGDIGLAREAIAAAAAAGADVVKFQSFVARNLVREDLGSVRHVSETGGGKSIFQLTREAELLPAWHAELKDFAESQGVEFMSTPEDRGMVALLESIGVPAFKVASLDVPYLDLIEAISRTGKPILMSTGMCTLGEVETTLAFLRDRDVREVVVLQCTSNYPPRDEDLNLRAMQAMAHAFDVLVGFSDHSMGIGASIAGVALGACVIERHFTLDRKLPGTDHRISLEPQEFALMAREIRTVEKALGSSVKGPVAAEQEMRRMHRRRLVAARDLEEGTELSREDIACKCSELGLEPGSLPETIGRRVKVAVRRDQPILSDILA